MTEGLRGGVLWCVGIPPVFLLINTLFMGVEFVYGFLSNRWRPSPPLPACAAWAAAHVLPWACSLGLISDACHMLFDCAALLIGLYASYISRLDSPSKYAYG